MTAFVILQQCCIFSHFCEGDFIPQVTLVFSVILEILLCTCNMRSSSRIKYIKPMHNQCLVHTLPMGFSVLHCVEETHRTHNDIQFVWHVETDMPTRPTDRLEACRSVTHYSSSTYHRLLTTIMHGPTNGELDMFILLLCTSWGYNKRFMLRGCS